MKQQRIKMLKECMEKIKAIQDCYLGAHSGWVLLQAAHGHVMSLHHLEAETTFDEKTLGVKGSEAEEE
jgi:hypothetical protein